MLLVVAPVLQRLPEGRFEVSVTFPPWQKVVGPPAVTTGVLGTATLTAKVSEFKLQPPEVLVK
jgi:hypothetical protein